MRRSSSQGCDGSAWTVTLAGSRPLPGERWWLDQCLYDIENTVMHAVNAAADVGAGAVVLYHHIAKTWGAPGRKYHRVIEACENRRLIIVTCDDDFQRRVHWVPPEGPFIPLDGRGTEPFEFGR